MGANVVVLGLLKGLGTALALSSEADAKERAASAAASAAVDDLGKTYLQNNKDKPLVVYRTELDSYGFDNPNATFSARGYEQVIGRPEGVGAGVAFYPTIDRNLGSDAFTGRVINNLNEPRTDPLTGKKMQQSFLAEAYYVSERNKLELGEDDSRSRGSVAFYNKLKTQHIQDIGTIINKRLQEAGKIAGEKGLGAEPLIPSFKANEGLMRAISVLPQAEIEDIFMRAYDFAAGEAGLNLSKEFYVPTMDELTALRSKYGLATPAELFESIKVQRLTGGPVSPQQIEEFKKQTAEKGFMGSDATALVNNKMYLADQLAQNIPEIKDAEAGARFINVLGRMFAPEGNQRGILNITKAGSEFDILIDSTAPPVVFDGTTYDENYFREIIPIFNNVEQQVGGEINFVGRDLLISVLASHLKKDLLETGTVGQMSRSADATQSGTLLAKLSLRKSFDGQTSNFNTYNLMREQNNVAFTTVSNIEGFTMLAVQRQQGQEVSAPIFGFVGALSLGLAGAKAQAKAAKKALFVFRDEEDDKLFNYMSSKYNDQFEIGGENIAVKDFLGADGQLKVSQLTDNQMTALLRFLAVQAVYQMARALENPTGGGARLSERDIQNMEKAFQLGAMTDPRQFLTVINYAKREIKIRKRYLDSQAKYRSMPFHAVANEIINEREGNLIDFGQAQVTTATDSDNIFNYAVSQIEKDFKMVTPSPVDVDDALSIPDMLEELNKGVNPKPTGI